MKQIPSFKTYLSEETKEVFFTFGRMNPMTTGHGKLLSALATKAGRTPYKVFLSQSQDAKKNPLSYEQKIKFVRKMFPKYGRNIILNRKIKTVFDVATLLYKQGYNRIVMVVGSDRIVEFETLLNKYNGQEGRHGFYNFESIKIVSAGARDPDADDVSGMSASKQRENAKNNDFTAFSQGVPTSMSNKDTKALFNAVRAGMGLKETIEFKNHVELESVSETREKYVSGQLFNEEDRVRIKNTGKEGYVYRLGANYLIVALDEGRISRQWLDNVERVEEQKKTDRWYKDKPEWGTPESTMKAKKKTPGQDEVKESSSLKKAKKLVFNPVAKHARTFNKATVQRDRKKDQRKGKVKHKTKLFEKE